MMTENGAKRGCILRGIGGFYTVLGEDGVEYTLRARGRFRIEDMTPLVGDRVMFLPGQGKEHGMIDEILPRQTKLVRPAVANISLLVVVVAAEPVPDLLLVDRLIVRAVQTGLSAVLCVNKCDLDSALAPVLQAQYAAAEVEVYPVSAVTEEGLSHVRERMEGELSCMAGQSAVGKSTLLNALCGLELKTGEISGRTRRGRHTTRHVELLRAGGLSVLDTPGFSLLSLEGGMEPHELAAHYPEYAALAGDCRFSPCLHDKEPDCAVRHALAEGVLSEERHTRYLTLLGEVQEAWKGRFG